MKHLIQLILLINLLFLQSCFVYTQKPSLTTSSGSVSNSTVSNLEISNDSLTISGSGFTKVTKIEINGNNFSEIFSISSLSDSKIIVTAAHAIAFGVDTSLNLILSSANAKATFPITFSLQNGAISAVHLSSMGATSGQILKYTGSAWAPSSISNSQVFLGSWDALNNNPDIGTLGTFTNGDYYIVSTAGTYNNATYAISDWVMFNGTTWENIKNASNVTSFNSRKGSVTLLPADYVSLKGGTSKIVGSSLNDFADVNISTVAPTNLQTLKWITATGKWEPRDDLSGGGAIGSTEIVDGSILNIDINTAANIDATKLGTGVVDNTEFNYLDGVNAAIQTQLNAKETAITAGSPLQYIKGDKSLGTLNTVSVVESTNLYFTEARVIDSPLTAVNTSLTTAITASDSILSALGKAQGQINLKATSASIVDWSVVGTPYLYPTRIYGGALQPNTTLVTDVSGNITTGLSNITFTSGTTLQIKGSASGSYAFPSDDSKAALDVAGSAITRTKTYASGSTFNMSLSNSIIVTAPTGSSFTLSNLQDGGSYNLAFQDNASTITPAFSMSGAESGAPSLTIYYSPALAARTSGKRLLVTLTRMGAEVYVNWQEF